MATTKWGGDCWTGSFVVHRGYRCASGNFIYDPCFEDPLEDDTVVCAGDPFRRHVIRLRVSGQMTNDFSARPGVVWAVGLFNGLRCAFFAGGATSTDSAGRRLSYGCGSSRFLWGNPIRRGRTWHIRLTEGPDPRGERLVAIRTAYIPEG